MVIKSDKGNTGIIIFLLIILVLVFLIIGQQSLIGALVVCAIPLLLALRYWIATGRTIVISENGCTVSFLWYKKHYLWEELKTKQFGDYKGCYGYRSPYQGGAEFSPSCIRKPVWLMPTEYSVLVHPLSYVFVYFRPNKLSTIDAQYPMIYTVDEVVFRTKLKEWGVPMKTGDGLGEP